jgi:hypothetical protein
MLHPILLQVNSATQGTPISAYITIGAAILSTLASLNATRVSSKTSQEVATLSSRTAKESARIAAETAKEIKDKDYKYEVYKKIIDKRLAAWEESEKFIASISTAVQDENDKSLIFKYCLDTESFEEVFAKIGQMLVKHSIWMGNDYAYSFTALHTEQVIIRFESVEWKKENELSATKDALLQKAGKKHFDRIHKLILELTNILRNQLVNLHDVDSFLKDIKEMPIGGAE